MNLILCHSILLHTEKIGLRVNSDTLEKFQEELHVTVFVLKEADAMAEQEAENATAIPSTTQPSNDMTLVLVQRMVDWDRRKRILEDWKWNVMNDVVQGRKPFTDRMKYAFYLNLEKLKKHGFEG